MTRVVGRAAHRHDCAVFDFRPHGVVPACTCGSRRNRSERTDWRDQASERVDPGSFAASGPDGEPEHQVSLGAIGWGCYRTLPRPHQE